MVGTISKLFYANCTAEMSARGKYFWHISVLLADAGQFSVMAMLLAAPVSLHAAATSQGSFLHDHLDDHGAVTSLQTQRGYFGVAHTMPFSRYWFKWHPRRHHELWQDIGSSWRSQLHGGCAGLRRGEAGAAATCGGRLGDHSGGLGQARAKAHKAGAGQVGQPDRQRGKKWGEVRPGARV